MSVIAMKAIVLPIHQPRADLRCQTLDDEMLGLRSRQPIMVLDLMTGLIYENEKAVRLPKRIIIKTESVLTWQTAE